MGTHFTPAALKFLKGLNRNNDREWFEARRELYERELKTPMLTLIDEVNSGLASFAPEHIRPAPKTMMRIYRDIRFSADKRPYKPHVAAWWARRGMEKTSGGGFYLQVSPKKVELAAGVFMPAREQLAAIRRWMAEHHEEYRTSLQSSLKPRKGDLGTLASFNLHSLTRMPKGFPADHPAGDLLRAQSWGVILELPAETALDPSFVRTIVSTFKRTTPIVEALNAAISASAPASTSAMNRFL
ncbi:MAG: DUF2461 domain-containing protein [Acidobacteriaceae bacterium]|nr:DUF2461 domain-containing protein [Acidobacteriaceae bacterium]